MKHFSVYHWYRGCQAACILLGACAVFCLWKLYNSLGATPDTIRFWFVSLEVSVGLFMPCIIGFYYFRAKYASWDPQQEALEFLSRTQSGKNGKNPVK